MPHAVGDLCVVASRAVDGLTRHDPRLQPVLKLEVQRIEDFFTGCTNLSLVVVVKLEAAEVPLNDLEARRT